LYLQSIILLFKLVIERACIYPEARFISRLSFWVSTKSLLVCNDTVRPVRWIFLSWHLRFCGPFHWTSAVSNKWELNEMVEGLSSVPFSSLFTLSTVVNTRGHTAKIAKNRCQLDIRRFFLSSKVIDRWNRLQLRVIDSGSVNSFKNGLDCTRKATMGFFTD